VQGQGAGVEACEAHIMDKISVGGTHIFFAADISIPWDHCSSVQNKFKKEQFMCNSISCFLLRRFLSLRFHNNLF